MWISKFGSDLNVYFGHLLTHLALIYREFKINGQNAGSVKLRSMLVHVVYDVRIMIETIGDIDSNTVCYALFNMIFELFEKIQSGSVTNLI